MTLLPCCFPPLSEVKQLMKRYDLLVVDFSFDRMYSYFVSFKLNPYIDIDIDIYIDI